MTQQPRFVINKSSSNEYYFVLKAGNSEIIATSEMYTTKLACENGIQSVKTNAPIASTIDITE